MAAPGAARVDLGISCEPEALRLDLRRGVQERKALPTLTAMVPPAGGEATIKPNPFGDDNPTSSQGLPVDPGHAPQITARKCRLRWNDATLRSGLVEGLRSTLRASRVDWRRRPPGLLRATLAS